MSASAGSSSSIPPGTWRERTITHGVPALPARLLSFVNIDLMDVVDAMLFALLALAEVRLIIHLHRRRQRRVRVERMTRSLRVAIRKEMRRRSGGVPRPRSRVAAGQVAPAASGA